MADHADIDHTGLTGVPGSNPQFTTIELGHASDTTLARVSAGVVSIEGTNIVKAGAVTSSGLTQATGKLLGRNTASTGAIEEITLGTNLSFSGTTLNASGGSAASGTLVEVDYVAFTSPVTPTHTSDATADTVVTANALSADGSTVYLIEFFAPHVDVGAGAGASANLILNLYDGSTDLGRVAQHLVQASGSIRLPGRVSHRLTPSNASHTYSIRAWLSGAGASGTVTAGAGGGATDMPGYVRIIKITP